MIAKRARGSVALLAAMALAWPAEVQAHGERVQAPFLRTRTITFYDVVVNPTRVAVGDRFSIAGRFYLARSWPGAATDPDVTALTVAAPGPVLLVKDRRIGAEFVPQKVRLNKGHTYDFRVDMMARRPGRWHLHPLIVVKGAGPLIGTGTWVEITPAPGGRDFRNELVLRSGQRVDLETFNVGNAFTWHLVYAIPALIFLLYFLRKPLVQRLALTTTGTRPDDLLTSRDTKFAVVMGILTLGLIIGTAIYAVAKWPDTIPLQVREATPAGTPAGDRVLAATVGPAHFSERRGEVNATVRFRNAETRPLTLVEYAVGDAHFTPQGGPQGKPGLLDAGGAVTVQPGQTQQVTVKLRSRLWDEDNLVPRDEVDNMIGGVWLFTAPDGTTQVAEARIPILEPPK